MGRSDLWTVELRPNLRICRILNGMWQVSGAHGRIDPALAVQAMSAYQDSGFTTWDLADHYGPAEDFIGEFRRQLLASREEVALSNLLAFTKWVPQPGRVTRKIVEESIARSLRRMNVPTLDLLQFHWWDYADLNYLEALTHLSDLQERAKSATWDSRILMQSIWEPFSIVGFRSYLTRCSSHLSTGARKSVWSPSARSAAFTCSRTAPYVAACCPKPTSNDRSPVTARSTQQAFRSTSGWWTRGAAGAYFRSFSRSSR